MQFLDKNECAVWLERRGLPRRADAEPDPNRQLTYFKIPLDAGERVQLCRQVWHRLDADDVLLWIQGWGVWPSCE
ncbi:MAG TPA: hypothetical protein VJP86_01840 [Vicinamibacterales bacterium]|nr:hypothetical protein [Vicinamibacterales bacterium]